MSYKYYRFHLLESEYIEPIKVQESAETYQRILDNAQGLGIVRTAIDLTSSDKTISILCQSGEETTQQSKLIEYLIQNKIYVNTTIESEELADDEVGTIDHHHHHHHDHKKHDDCCHHENDNDCSEDELSDCSEEDCSEEELDHCSEEDYSHEHTHHSHEHTGHSHKHSEHSPKTKGHSPKTKGRSPKTKGHSHSHHHGDDHHGHHHDHDDNHWLKAGIGLIWGASLLILSLLSLNIPMIAYYILTGISSLMTLYLGRSVYLSAWRALREKRWDMTTLYSISTLAIVVVSILSTFVPGLPLMFETAPLVLGFWHLGEGIEHSLLDKINTKLDVRDCLSPSVKLKNHPDEESPVTTLIPNDVIIINAGEVLPVDGVLTQSAVLYTTRIDGSPYPKEFKAGDAVKAGMTLADHIPSLEILVTKTYQSSYLSSIAKNINKANDEKAPVEKFANKILKYFVPGLLAIALISGIVIGIFFNPALAIQCVISVLVSACPCTLSLITPLSVKIGMKKASENGVLFKNGVALQSAADIDTVVFDFNGTLTQGEVSVKEIHLADKNLLTHIALLESQSNHPIARIIKSHIEQQSLPSDTSLEITGIDQSHHSGIKGIINGETYMVGNKDMLAANGITQFTTPYNNPENGSIYVVRGTTVVGQIHLTDTLRKDAIETVKHLQALGKKVHICTGSDIDTVSPYAKLLGIPIENVCANASGIDETDSASNTASATLSNPKEMKFSKIGYINSLKKKKCKVAMVGDAVNDIPAIAAADLGIAVKSSIGDSLTEHHAGIVVQQGLLFPIATAFDVSQKTKKNIYQNLFVSLAYNSAITLVAAGLFVAIGFALNPAIGIALMVLESTIVLANLYRLKKQSVITAESAVKPQKEEAVEDTTAKVLHSLGHKHQPEKSVEWTEAAEVSEAAEIPLGAMSFSAPSPSSAHGVHLFFSTGSVKSTKVQNIPEETEVPLVQCA